MIAPYAYVDTSALGATELIRACRRALSKKQLTQVEDVLGAVVLMDVTRRDSPGHGGVSQ